MKRLGWTTGTWGKSNNYDMKVLEEMEDGIGTESKKKIPERIKKEVQVLLDNGFKLIDGGLKYNEPQSYTFGNGTVLTINFIDIIFDYNNPRDSRLKYNYTFSNDTTEITRTKSTVPFDGHIKLDPNKMFLTDHLANNVVNFLYPNELKSFGIISRDDIKNFKIQ